MLVILLLIISILFHCPLTSLHIIFFIMSHISLTKQCSLSSYQAEVYYFLIVYMSCIDVPDRFVLTRLRIVLTVTCQQKSISELKH